MNISFELSFDLPKPFWIKIPVTNISTEQSVPDCISLIYTLPSVVGEYALTVQGFEVVNTH